MNRKTISIRTFISIKYLSLLLLCGACNGSSAEGDSGQGKLKSRKDTPVVSRQEQAKQTKGLTDATVVPFLEKYAAENKENIITVKTDFGDIKIRLYQNTPLHRANMIFLAERDYFDGTWFYRVNDGHVIQAGNNDEMKTLKEREQIGKYTIPPEALNKNYHKTGAVAAARSYKGNEAKRSDPYEFYINLGQTYSEGQLRAMEDQYDIKLNARQMELYQTVGGSPHLDGEHTVFGEVISGMDVVREISKVETDRGEWPLKNIPISVKVSKK